MNILIDTSVWSLALRRRRPGPDPVVTEAAAVIAEGRAVMIGPVRQELLSGVAGSAQFSRLRDHLRAFPDLALVPEDYEEAALFFNRCRAKGIQGSNTDFLICAAAARRELGILTTDRDFLGYARVLPVVLLTPRAVGPTRSEVDD